MQPARAQSIRGGGWLETEEFTSDVLAPEAWRLPDAPPMKIRASAAARGFLGGLEPLVTGAVRFVALHTNGNGARGLHATFGLPDSGEVVCKPCPRSDAADVLRQALCSGREVSEDRLKKIREMIWQDLAKASGLASMNGNYIRKSEARAYWRHSSSTAKERIISALQMRQVQDLVAVLKLSACDRCIT